MKLETSNAFNFHTNFFFTRLAFEKVIAKAKSFSLFAIVSTVVSTYFYDEIVN